MNWKTFTCEQTEKGKCIFFNNITVTARNVISISIRTRKRDNIKGNHVTCPISSNSRDKIIKQVTKSPLIQSQQLTSQHPNANSKYS